MSPQARPTRRRFLVGLAGSGAAIATLGADAAAATTRDPEDLEPWLAPLRGRHRIVFDVPRWNDGYVLPYARAWLDTVPTARGIPAAERTAMLVFRHFATPMVLDHAMWEKYPLGELFHITDPVTRAPARRNLYVGSVRGDTPWPDASLDRLHADGAVLVVCALALRIMSSRAATRIGVTPADAAAEWAQHLVPGTAIAPSGTIATMRAQEVGAAYSFAG